MITWFLFVFLFFSSSFFSLLFLCFVQHKKKQKVASEPIQLSKVDKNVSPLSPFSFSPLSHSPLSLSLLCQYLLFDAMSLYSLFIV